MKPININEIQLDKNDIDTLHDVLFNALELDNFNLSEIQIIDCWKMLPYDIQLDAIKWGISDTVVRDHMYVWFQKNIKNKFSND